MEAISIFSKKKIPNQITIKPRVNNDALSNTPPNTVQSTKKNPKKHSVWHRLINEEHEIAIVFLSVVVQLPLALLLGHYYDMRIFMATGYLTNAGLNPYMQYDLGSIFPNPLFKGILPVIGYPPLWPLILGLIYRISYGIIPNLFLYNLAIKIPIVFSNICLAYVVRGMLIHMGATSNKSFNTWLFILYNPFILYISSAWGQIDGIVVLLSVASLYFFEIKRTKESAILIAISITLKPIAIAIVPILLAYSYRDSFLQALRYLIIFTSILVLTYLVPFFIFNWSTKLVLEDWNYHFISSGGMSYMSFLEVLSPTTTLPSNLQFIGYLWMPIVLVSFLALNFKSIPSTKELVEKALCLTLIFFLSRAWLSEPNIYLVLALAVLLVGTGELSERSLHLLWIIPMIFTILNFSLPQLFFLVSPSILTYATELDKQFYGIRLVARAVSIVPWQILGWSIAIRILRKQKC